MPGIVGLVTKIPSESAKRQLLCMVDALCHEPFYTKGIWLDERLGVYVGWVARKGSFSDGMPLCNERGDISLTFSGEDFPEPGTVERLKKRGHVVNAEGPSYIVHLYEEDPAFPVGLNGRFQGLLTDRSQGTSILFNDRYGMSRIYYHEGAEAFYFAAEAKAILAVRPELRNADPKGLAEFVACGCILENRTLFREVRVLPCGANWLFRDGCLERKGTYFHPQDWENQTLLDPEAYYQELHRTFLQNLPRYFNGRERVGMSLTGGLDTRIVLASHKAVPGTLPCYSFAGMFRESEDVILARRVAAACGQPYQVINVGKEFLSNFARYAERTVYLSEGCTDVSHSPDLFANEHAAAIATVRMTGNYGSEVLRGTRAFKPVAPLPGLFTPDFLRYVDSASATYCEATGGHPVSFAAFRQAPWHHYGLLALEQTQLAVRSPFLDNDFVRTVFRAPQQSFTNANISLRLIADGNKSLLQIRTDRGLAGERRGFAATACRKFLDVATKAEYVYDYGMPQWLAQIDHFVSALHLERLFLGRQKFYHFRIWYRDFLHDYVQSMLLDSRTLSRPYLRRTAIESMVHDHLKGKRNYTLAIHKLLTLELVHRLFIDSSVGNTSDRSPLRVSSDTGAIAEGHETLAQPR
ncbi:MAG: asparagine synthase-related protein [Terriglobales bacterium]